MKRKLHILISGGGTGGHIFPALSIAAAMRRRTDCEILFVGAENRMEMEKVPAAGYDIIGLPVAGFDRRRLWRNIAVLWRLLRSIRRARTIVRTFRPDIAVGVGGYASGPTLKAAQRAGVPTLLQEQNSYAGVTNKLLARRAERICVAYPDMERFFPADKIILTGNPTRRELTEADTDPRAARHSFGLAEDRPTLLVTGGSLGALTLNEALEAGLSRLTDAGIQVIWQTGKNFGTRAEKAAKSLKGVVVAPFMADMAKAYAAATLVVSRAGAGSISEIELLGKPAILVPSPNVAEDHQTKNAQALASRGAAILIADADARRDLVPAALSAITDQPRLRSMAEAASALALRDSDERIADEIIRIIEQNRK